MRLIAYDAGGNVVASSSPATVTEGAGIHTLLSVSTSTATIVGFKVTARTASVDDNKLIAIDDLSFDIPTSPPPLDFTLTPTKSLFNIVQGGSATDTISIERIGGSNGGVSFSISGTLPPGMHAQFSPNPADGTSTTLTLTVDPGATVTTGTNATVTVTGTPAGVAVGATPRSFVLSLAVQQAFDISVAPSTNVDLSACNMTVPVSLSRNLSFAGQVALSVTGLPPGVAASFSSTPVTFPTGQGSTGVTLTLVAPANGQTLLRRTATIHATSPPLGERDASFTLGGTCPEQYDAQVTSLQITQGVQSPFLPVRDPAHPPSVTAYSEIPNAAELRAGGPTVVRVYADLAFGPNGGVPNVPAVLAGYTKNGVGSIVPLPGSPITSTSGPRTLQLGPAQATDAEEGSETDVYTFTLPPSWTHGQIGVVGQLLPAQTPPPGQSPLYAPCQTTTCLNNDTMTISRIPFYAAPGVTIGPVAMEVNGNPPPDPSTVFAWARLVTPLAVSVEPYRGTIDISDLANTFNTCVANHHGQAEYDACSDHANDDTSSRLDDWVCDNGSPDPGWDIGVNTGVARGVTNPSDICWDEFSTAEDAVVEWQRPLTSVAHEFFHLLGRPHASYCGGGGDNGQTAETWPPDEMGFTQSVGLDTTLGSGLHGGPYAVSSPPGQTWFDFLSYCADAADTASPLTLLPGPSWGSTHNWNAVMEGFRYHAADHVAPLARATSAPRPSLEVSGFLYPDGTGSIDAVTPLRASSRALPDSGIELVGLDAAGREVTKTPMREDAIHVDGEAPPVGLDGVIPSARVASVEIISNGTVLATRSETAHAPTVSLRGLPVARRGKTTIRWRAHDPDGGSLVASIDYSATDGRTSRRIWIGPSRGVVSLRSRYLSRSSQARVEITVNDGFRTSSADSRRFRAPGAPPIVTILSPAAGARSPNDAPLVLSGQAFDDAGNAIGGRRLRWLLGRRVLGAGAEISAVGLHPGRDQIVLEARDRNGRTGHASLIVKLQASRPLFLELSAPKRVTPGARSLTLRVRSSLDAQLTVRTGSRASPQRFAVSRRLRTLRVRIVPGTQPVTLRLSLSAGRLTRIATVSVRR